MATARLGLTWSPGWFHPHESLWSVMAKLATANCADLDCLSEYAHLFSRDSDVWLPSDKQRALWFFSDLELSSMDARTSFLFDLVPSERERALVGTAIRYCQSCLKEAYHSVLFQFLPLVRCPIHDEPLEETCTHCGSPLNPSRGFAWTCHCCGTVIAGFSYQRWLQSFESDDKRPLMDEMRSILAFPTQIQGKFGESWFDTPYLSDPRGYTAFVTGTTGTAHLQFNGDIHTSDDGYWETGSRALKLLRWFYEEYLVLTETVLASHVACCDYEHFALASQLWRSVSYRCPVAAAILQSAAYAKIPWTPGSWIARDPHVVGVVQQRLVPEIIDKACARYLNERAAVIIVRTWARAVIADALETFITNQDSGRAEWHGEARSMRYFVHWYAEERAGGWVMHLKTNATLAAIRKLVEHARCSRGATTPLPA